MEKSGVDYIAPAIYVGYFRKYKNLLVKIQYNIGSQLKDCLLLCCTVLDQGKLS